MDKLKAVIERAVENGWEDEVVMNTILYNYTGGEHLILFTHNFAKAFFGEQKAFVGERYTDGEDIENLQTGQSRMIYEKKMILWQYHLQQAVLSESPLDYYYNYLTKQP